MGRDIPELDENLSVHSHNPAADGFISPDMESTSNLDLSNRALDTFSEEIETELSSKYDELYLEFFESVSFFVSIRD